MLTITALLSLGALSSFTVYHLDKHEKKKAFALSALKNSPLSHHIYK